MKALICTCGDCAHWEIINHGLKGGIMTLPFAHLKCKTCGHEFPIEIAIPDHDKLKWVDKDVT